MADEGISDLFTIVAASSPCSPSLIITATPSQTITSGGSVTLTASGGSDQPATTYTWSNGSTDNPLVLTNVTSATAFSVTGVTGGCSATASAAVSVSAAVSPCASTPGNITVIGPGIIGFIRDAERGGEVYVPDGTLNSAPKWKSTNGEYRIVWTNTAWEFQNISSSSVIARNTTGSATNLPCNASGWIDPSGDYEFFNQNGMTLSGGCGLLVGGPSVSIAPSSPTITSGGSVTLTASGRAFL